MKIEISKQRSSLAKRGYHPFEILESGIAKDKIVERLSFWIDVNNAVVSSKGEGYKNMFRVREEYDECI